MELPGFGRGHRYPYHRIAPSSTTHIRHTRVGKLRLRLHRPRGLVAIDAALLDNACSLAEIHALRAGDAIQLSTLMTIEQEDLTFACWDGALRAAATAEGYAVFPADEGGFAQQLIQN